MAAAPQVVGPCSSTAPPSPPQAIELALHPYLGDVKSISVGTGSSSLPYVFDTGGGLTVLTPEEAKRLGCEPVGRLSGFRATGERLDMPHCGPVRLQLGALAVEAEAGILDVNSLIGHGAPRVGGVVALQSLHGHAFTLDYAHNRVTIESASSLAQRITKLHRMEVRPEAQAGGATLDLFVAVRTLKGNLWLELDSGNTGPVKLAPHAVVQLGLSPVALDRGETDLDFSGLGRIPVRFVVQEGIYDGLLNAKTLEALTLTIDLRSMQMWGAPAAAPATTRSGPDSAKGGGM